jgi:hypothetical protein
MSKQIAEILKNHTLTRTTFHKHGTDYYPNIEIPFTHNKSVLELECDVKPFNLKVIAKYHKGCLNTIDWEPINNKPIEKLSYKLTKTRMGLKGKPGFPSKLKDNKLEIYIQKLLAHRDLPNTKKEVYQTINLD